MYKITGFFAFPGHPAVIGQTIHSAIIELHRYQSAIEVCEWPQLDIPGRFIADAVLGSIDTADFLVADITELNFNVTYEVGYAIGRGKRILLVRNEPFVTGAADLIKDLGIFDTLGYRSYENSKELAAVLKQLPDLRPLPIDASPNRKTPVYLTEDKWRTDGATRIISRIKKARISFRSFDPREQSRLSAVDAIKQVAQSFGVLVHLVADSLQGAKISNLRASFIAGIAAGMNKVTALLQQGTNPVPLDYRDLVLTYDHPAQIDDHVSDFAGKVYESLQIKSELHELKSKSDLAKFELGASSAENELQDLHHYYLPTESYRRALRGDVRLVVGRKGSGKTAVFLQVRDKMRRSRKNVVLDLKPDGYRLIKFKDRVLVLLERGSFEHTITAFWECLLLLEIAHKVIESDRENYKFEDRSLGAYRDLVGLYQSYGYEAQGDFAERMSALLTRIENDYSEKFGATSRMISSSQITELLYGKDIRTLQTTLVAYLRFKDSVWVLFDNIDKGWSAQGLQGQDLIIVKALVEATRKIERDLQRNEIDAHTLMFIRNDIFEILIDEMSDRGKEPKALLDWSDGDLLRELILRRARYNSQLDASDFQEMWAQICVSHVSGEESSQYLIDRCLMRPRYSIDLINHCRGSAVTLRHDRIEQSDIQKGMQVFSADLLADLSHEVRDVYPRSDDVLYAFIGKNQELSSDEVQLALMEQGIPDGEIERLIDLLLWYGFLGCLTEAGEIRFIHDVTYNPKLLKAHIKNRSAQAKSYSINPGFWPVLGIRAK